MFKFLKALLSCSIIGTTALAQTGTNVPQLASFDVAMTNLLSQYGIPGGQLAITYHGRLVYNRGFGYANTNTQTLVQPNSLFRIASISKPITSVTIMKMFENGLINLDAKVFGPSGILNDTTYQSILDPRINDITVRMLLQHAGGWNRNLSGDPMFNAYQIATTMGVPPPADAVTVIRFQLANVMLDFDPGTQSQYSNFGYCVLGRVIEKISGQNYDDYVKSNILNAVGIADMSLGFNLQSGQLPNEVTYYDYPSAPYAYSVYNNSSLVPTPYGGFNLEAMDAHGGWVASAEDLCKLLVAIDRFNTRPDILQSATIDTMIKPSLQDPNYACGFNINTFNNWWHTGALPGSSTEIVRAGNQQMNWALFCNTRDANGNSIATAIDNLVWSVLPSITSWPSNDLFTSLEEQQSENQFSIVPNPASSAIDITVKNKFDRLEFSILDICGKEVYHTLVSGNSHHVDLKNFENGIYFINILSDKKMMSRKLIVQH